jgi:endonuclease/exonuclease/phosphatase (EEP) superfamily protein YafD
VAQGREEEGHVFQLQEDLYRLATELTYRLRPEHPLEELQYIRIAYEAERRMIERGTPLSIVVWNTFKGKRARYYELLAAQAADADLILLQEFRHDPALESAYRELFVRHDAEMAVSFYTRPNQGAPTGVCTVSRIRSLRSRLLLSRYFEPVTRTPKMAICSLYAVGRPDCPPEESLLVLNSHGINFRLRRPFRDQMAQFEEQLHDHRGPVVLVGDFNTWEQGRVRILEEVARANQLQRVRFPHGVKAVRGHELDRVYVRGGVWANTSVVRDSGASDHSMLRFTLTLE